MTSRWTHPAPGTAEQHRWLLPVFATLTLVGLPLLVMAVATGAWLVVASGALTTIGNALGWWNQLRIRRDAGAGGGAAS